LVLAWLRGLRGSQRFQVYPTARPAHLAFSLMPAMLPLARLRLFRYHKL
jgi:hypothetical protein